MSVSPTNPSTLFGGTWVAWGSGRVPVGVNTSDSNFNTVEKTGGESTHTLTINEIPSHNHFTGIWHRSGGSTAYYAPTTGNMTAQMGTSNTGGGYAHNNLQPYITCYMWKRTA